MSTPPKTASQQLADDLRDRNALNELVGHRGWAALVEEYNARVAAMDAQVFDSRTDCVKAETLRQVHIKLENEFSPTVLMQELLTKLNAKAAKHAAEGAKS